MDDEIKSFNLETGMVEDIEEVRILAVNIIDGFLRTLLLPIVQATTDPGTLFDLAFSLILVRSSMKFTSQAQLYREMAGLFGQTPAQTEEEIRRYNMSEEFAYTSSNATPVNIDHQAIADSLRNGRLFQSSTLIQQVVREAESAPSNVHLSSEIESFLQSLQKHEGNEHGNDADPDVASH